MYLLVVVKVESGIDIMEDNFLFGVQVRYPKSGIDLDGSLGRYGHPRISYLDSVMRNLPNLIHS